MNMVYCAARSPARPRPVVRLEARPAVRLEARPVVRQEARPAVRLEARPAVRLEARPVVRSRRLSPCSHGLKWSIGIGHKQGGVT